MADIGKIFKNIAPFLSTAISFVPGGGPVASIAATVLSKVTGSEVKADDIAKTMQNLSTSEEGRLKLQESEQEYQKAMKQLGFENEEKIEELGNEDRDSARKREMAVKDKIPAILAILVTMGFFGMLLFICIRGIPTNAHDFVIIMLTSLATAWVSIIAYYFGSSSGSAAKTQLLAQASPIVQKP